jgi:hypothetical protein
MTGRRSYLILRTDGANRRFEFEKRAQLFIGVRNETLSVAAMRVSNFRSFACWNPRSIKNFP